MLVGLAGLLAMGSGGCAGSSGAASQPASDSARLAGNADPARPSGPRGGGDDRPVAIVGESPVAFADMSLQMAELAGGVALREFVLDAALGREIASAGVRVGPAEAARERELLLSNLAEESRVSGDQAERLLERVRVSRGLGPVRFGELLYRNAKLRALVQNDIAITPELLDREVMLQTTARARIRLLVTVGQREAAAARERVVSAPTGLRSATFAEEAIVRSTDASAGAGGLVEAIHASDPAIPAAIRAALAGMQAGDVSDVLAIDGGFAVVLFEGQAAAAMPEGTPRAAIERRLRGRLERLAMDALAQRLLRESNVRVLEGSMAWSWENAR